MEEVGIGKFLVDLPFEVAEDVLMFAKVEEKEAEWSVLFEACLEVFEMFWVQCELSSIRGEGVASNFWAALIF